MIQKINEFPLIEDIPEDNGNKLVTFFYECHQDIHSIALYSPLIGNFPVKMNRRSESKYFYYSITVPNNIRVGYAFIVNDETSYDTKDREKSLKLFSEMWPKLICDPCNPKRQILSTGEVRATITVSILEMPDATPVAWSQISDSIPKGVITKHHIDSKTLQQRRDYWVYLPYSYDKKQRYPLLLVFDGQLYHDSGISLPCILDNLIYQRKIPPVIAVLIDSIGFITRRHDLNCSERFLNFITDDLLKSIKANFSISDARSDRILMGGSLGGAFSLYAALKRSDLFGKVLSNSGGGNEEIKKLIEGNNTDKIKVYLDVGSLEDKSSIIQTRDLLSSNGHEVIYHEYPGAHDLLCWESTIPNALIRLLE